MFFSFLFLISLQSNSSFSTKLQTRNRTSNQSPSLDSTNTPYPPMFHPKTDTFIHITGLVETPRRINRPRMIFTFPWEGVTLGAVLPHSNVGGASFASASRIIYKIQNSGMSAPRGPNRALSAPFKLRLAAILPPWTSSPACPFCVLEFCLICFFCDRNDELPEGFI